MSCFQLRGCAWIDVGRLHEVRLGAANECHRLGVAEPGRHARQMRLQDGAMSSNRLIDELLDERLNLRTLLLLR
jgi:hypothetical protein